MDFVDREAARWLWLRPVRHRRAVRLLASRLLEEGQDGALMMEPPELATRSCAAESAPRTLVADRVVRS